MITIEKVKRRWVIKPRFYILCLVVTLFFTNMVIMDLADELEAQRDLNIILEQEIEEQSRDILINDYITDQEEITSDILATLKPLEETNLRYGFTDEDIYLLAQLLCGGKDTDGDGEYDIDFQEEINYYEVGKVLGVVMNRVRSDDFPDTVYDVVTQKGQFSPMPENLNKEPSDIALRTVREWCDAYDNGSNFIQIIPENHLYFAGNGVINKTRANYK